MFDCFSTYFNNVDGGSQRFGMADCTEWEFDKTQFTNTITGIFTTKCHFVIT